MFVHYMQGVVCAASLRCLHGPLVGIPIGVHTHHSARIGHPTRLKIGTLAEPLPAFGCSEEVFAMDILILAESRLSFRHGHTVQPFAFMIHILVVKYEHGLCVS